MSGTVQSAPSPDQPTIGQIIEAYLGRGTGGHKHRAAVQSHFKRLVEYFGEVPVSEMSDERAMAFTRERQEEGRAPSTIKTQLDHLRIALTWAAREKLIPEVPYFRSARKVARSVAAEGFTVDQLLDDYLQQRSRELDNIAATEYHFVSLRKHLGEFAVESIDQDKVNTFINARFAEGRTQGTVEKQLRMFRAALNWAHRTNRIGRVPYFKTPGPPPERERFLSAVEYQSLLDAANDAQTPFHIRVFFNIALLMAQKPGDIMSLTWDRVRFDAGKDGEIEFGDGDDTRVVPMHSDVTSLLIEARRRRESDRVIEWRGEPVKVIFGGFNAVAERAGLEDLRQMDLRPSWALLKLKAGVSVYEVAAVLGDDPGTVWKKYARHLPDLMYNAIHAPITVGKKRS